MRPYRFIDAVKKARPAIWQACQLREIYFALISLDLIPKVGSLPIKLLNPLEHIADHLPAVFPAHPIF